MLPLLRIGLLVIQAPGLAVLAGVWIGLDLLSREAVRLKLDADRVYSGAFYTLAAGIAGARLTFVVLHRASYRSSLLSVLSIAPGSEIPLAGVGLGLLAGYLYLRRYIAPGWTGWAAVVDALAPALAALAAFAALANVFSGDGYGLQTGLPWGIELWSAKRHPTQFYELAAALAVLAALWRWRCRWPYPGGAFLAFVILYGAARVFLEAFRDDSWFVLGSLRGTQVIALLAVTVALIVVARRSAPHPPTAGASPEVEHPASGEEKTG